MAYNSASQILLARREVTTSWAADAGTEFFGGQSTTQPNYHTLGRAGALENVRTPVSIFGCFVKIDHPTLAAADADATETYNRIRDVRWARDLVLETLLGDQVVDARPVHSVPHSAMLLLGTQGAKGGTTATDGIGDTAGAENAGNPWPFPRINWPQGATLRAFLRNAGQSYTIVGTGGLLITVGYQIAPQGAA